MTSPTPVFRFSRAEPRLLECALLDQTDQEAANVLQVTTHQEALAEYQRQSRGS